MFFSALDFNPQDFDCGEGFFPVSKPTARWTAAPNKAPSWGSINEISTHWNPRPRRPGNWS